MKEFTWQERPCPLPPSGILIESDQRASAMMRLLALDDKLLRHLRGGYCESVLVVLGEERDLPWIPGGIYLGKEMPATHLFMPTFLAPDVPVDLLGRAITNKFGNGQFVIQPWTQQLYDLSNVITLSRASLEQIL
nr:hypothetical protein [Microbulbifer guangxiensis]